VEGSRSRSRSRRSRWTARRRLAATEARSMLCKTGWWFIVEKGQLHMIDHLRSQTLMLALPSTVENAGRVFPDFEEMPTRVKVHEVLLVMNTSQASKPALERRLMVS